MKHKKQAAILATVLAFVTVLSACSSGATTQSTGTGNPAPAANTPAAAAQSSAAPSETTVQADEIKWHITIPGKSGSLCNTPTYVAYEKGFFAEEGIDAELISSNFESNKVGLANGTISTVNGDFQMFPSIEAGVEMTIVDGLHQGCIKLQVLPDSPIQNVQDIVGKKVGVDEIGGTPHQVALLWLAQNGIDPSRVTFLPFDGGAVELEALQSGAIDVAAMWDPLASTAEKAGTVRNLLDIGKDEPFAGHYCCFLYASKKLVAEQPELIAAELRAYHKAQAWINENPAEAVKLVTETGYVSTEDIDLATSLIDHYHYPAAHEHGDGAGVDVEEDVRYFAQSLYDVGFLTMEPDEFVRTAYTEIDLSL